MAIYSRRGDDGSTARPGGRRVRKSDPAVRAIGELDELTSQIGLCLAACDAAGRERVKDELTRIQGELMAIAAMSPGAERAEAAGTQPNGPGTDRLEQFIDSAEGELGQLKTFILPGGYELACRLHVARAVCRRAEREVVAWADAGAAVPPAVPAYLNRLSDALFVLARLANREAGVEEVPWPPEGPDG